MNDNMVLLIVVASIAGAILFGGHVGATTASLPASNTTGGIGFLWELMTFKVDGAPVWFGIVLDAFMIVLLFVVVKVLRGSNS